MAKMRKRWQCQARSSPIIGAVRHRLHRPCAALGLLLVLLLALPGLACAGLAENVAELRSTECGRALAPLRHDPKLDEAARLRATGTTLHDALAHSGYVASSSAGLHAEGSERAVREALRNSGCGAVANPEFRDAGYYAHGKQAWIVLAAPYPLPSAAEGAAFAASALQLVNEARAHGARCGNHRLPPAPPLRSSATLEQAAAAHAQDMAQRGYFDHYDRAGRSPAERAREAGYRESLVGENIAYGPATPAEVVAGWLNSPEHCENLLDARFTEMGIAFAVGHGEQRPGLYWVQELGLPAP
jgi:uncharacterized protein YkwD